MFSEDEILQNKEEFLFLLESALQKREGSKFAELKDVLENSDFFIAPASTKYHYAIRGGLCAHSLHVFRNLMDLLDIKDLTEKISLDSATIVSLLHDFSKMNLYKESSRNKKVYHENGTKRDELGSFDWVAEKSYTTVDENLRFIYGNHEETSEFMIRQFIPLTYIESAAILTHHMGMSYDSIDSGCAMKTACTYELAALLHVADFLAAAVDEKNNE